MFVSRRNSLNNNYQSAAGHINTIRSVLLKLLLFKAWASQLIRALPHTLGCKVSHDVSPPSSWIKIRLVWCGHLVQNLMFGLFFSWFPLTGWRRSWRSGSQTSQMSPRGRMSSRSSAELRLRREWLSRCFFFSHVVCCSLPTMSMQQVLRWMGGWMLVGSRLTPPEYMLSLDRLVASTWKACWKQTAASHLKNTAGGVYFLVVWWVYVEHRLQSGRSSSQRSLDLNFVYVKTAGCGKVHLWFWSCCFAFGTGLKAGGEDRIVKCFPPRPPGSLCQGGHTASATAEQVFFSFVEVNLKWKETDWIKLGIPYMDAHCVSFGRLTR